MDNNQNSTEISPVEQQIKMTSLSLCDQAKALKILSRADLSHATDVVKTIKNRWKDAEDERKRIVKPFNEGVAAINSRFKTITVPLEDAETMLKNKMLTFQREEAARAETERKRQQAEQDEADRKERERLAAEEKAHVQHVTEGEEQDRPALPPVVTPPPAPVVSNFRPTTYGQSGATSTMKKVWKSEVTDVAQVPKEYIMVDFVKVNQAMKLGIRTIPGIRIYQDETLAIK